MCNNVSNKRRLPVLFFSAWLVLITSITSGSAADISFNRDIRPILTNHCYQCHGPDEQHREANLRLDDAASALAPRDGSPAIVPGKPKRSELISRITSPDHDLVMPPRELKKDLTPEQIATLVQWIQDGAKFEEHWAFQSPQRPTPPKTESTWPQNSIDHFVLAQMQSLNLAPNDPASREILIRRITLDLTGIPPTIDEIDSFLADKKPDAYSRLVQRLLHSPKFGERMAVDWLDAARYGDSSVFHADGPRDMWAWRDWVINAFNNNKSYKDFTIEQLAGDLLPTPTVDQQIASGFNRNHGTTDEGGAIAEEYRVEYIVDRIKTTSTVWLGLTLECAQCHDHKYDPFTQEEYYQLFAYFNQASDKGMQTRRGNEPPIVQVLNPRDQAKIPLAKEQLAALQNQLTKYRAQANDQYDSWLADLIAKATNGPILPPGRIAFVEFTEQQGAEITALSDPPTKGKYIGTPKWLSGEDVQAIILDGQSHVDFGKDLANFEGTEEFSIGATIKPDKTLTGAILSRMKDSNNFKGYDFLLSGGNVEIHIIHQWADDAIKVSTKEKVKADTLQHIMFTYDGSQKASGISVYFDGVAQQLNVQQDSLKNSIKADTSLKFGKRDNSLNYKGEIHAVSFYDRKLTAEEVKLDAGQDALTPILVKSADDRTEDEEKILQDRFFSQDKTHIQFTKQIAAQQARITELNKPLTSVMVMGDVATMRPTFVLDRGNYASPKKDKEILPGLPSAISIDKTELPQNRLGLAQWLTDDQHPLTSRVTVNRIWQMFFGHGIVKTTGDFGSQGESPTHPKLLDWLAVEFVESDWDLKHLIHLITTSATYQQSSHATPTSLKVDPQNRYYSRGPRFRLQAEFIRDTALSASGLLLNQIGGPGVKPFQPDGLWNEVSLSGNVRFKQDTGANNYRRSMYTYWKRSAPAPAMTIFDVPTREKCVVQRPRTNTPLQALVTLNDPQYLEAATALAKRLQNHHSDPHEQIKYGYRLVTGRHAKQSTVRILNEYLQQELQRFKTTPDAAAKLLKLEGDSLPQQTLEQAALTLLSNLLLNLDATITRG